MMSKNQSRNFIFTQQPPHTGDNVYSLFEGPAHKCLREISDKSVRCWVTSPPYFRKFTYGHEHQCGLESSIDEYLEYQIIVAREMLRASTSDANLFWVIQDSFNGSGGPGGDFLNNQGSYRVTPIRGACIKKWPRKGQLLIPERTRLAFAEVGWVPILRIIWDKGDSRRGAVDRPSYSYEEILLFAASSGHYWNRDAVLSPFADSTGSRLTRTFNYDFHDHIGRKKSDPTESASRIEKLQKRGGAFLRSVWQIASVAQPTIIIGSQTVRGIASFPSLLPEICINLGSAPGDIIGDPYAGFGTTLMAALKWGRNAIGIELNPQFAEATRYRIGIEFNREYEPQIKARTAQMGLGL